MRKISKLSVITLFFFIAIFVALFLVSSCAAPMKKAKPAQGRVKQSKQSGKIEKSKDNNSKENVIKHSDQLTPQNHELIHQRIEQRLNKMERRLKGIERMMGTDMGEEDISSEGEDTLSDSIFVDGKNIISDSSNISESPLNDELSSKKLLEKSSEQDTPVEILTPEDSPNDVLPPDVSQPYNTQKSSNLLKSSHISKTSNAPEVLYNKARTLLLDRKFADAEKDFKAVANNYPNHALAVNSYYWMGECRYSMKDYKGAIAIFKELVEKYPNGRKVPDALLKTAYAYLAINDTENGREYLKTVVKRFPFAPAGEKAEEKLKSIK